MAKITVSEHLDIMRNGVVLGIALKELRECLEHLDIYLSHFSQQGLRWAFKILVPFGGAGGSMLIRSALLVLGEAAQPLLNICCLSNSLLCNLEIIGIHFNADKFPTQLSAGNARSTASHEGVYDDCVRR